MSRISNLQDRIEELENRLNVMKMQGCDADDMVDIHLELQECRDNLNFAWQDDEADYNYALERQEFNPDGSLALY